MRGIFGFILGTCLTFLAVVIVSSHTTVQSRPAIQVSSCDDCVRKKELAGILASIGVQLTPNLVPLVTEVTDKCMVMKHFKPAGQIHLVAFPRKDIKDFGDIKPEDIPYIQDCISLLQKEIQKNNLTKYKILSNGPFYQDVRMLHIHLIGDLS